MKLKTKIILVFIIAATFPVSVLGIVSTQTYEKEMTERIDNFHNKSATLTAAGISDFLVDVSHSIALTSQVIPFDQFPPDDLPDALRIPYRQFDFVNIIALLNEEGEIISRPAFEENPKGLKGLERHESIKVEDIKQFVKNIPLANALKNGSAFGPSYYSPRTETPRVTFAVSFPVNQNQGSWVLAAEISLANILEKIRSTPATDRGTAFIVDQNGHAVCHKDAEFMKSPSSLNSLDIVLHGQKAQKTLTRRYLSLKGVMMAGAYAPIATTGWGLVVAQPVDQAFAVIEKVQAITLFWICLALSVAVLGGVLLARGFNAPVRELVQGAERIASNNFGLPINIKTKDEMGQLAATFNHMQSELKNSFDTITEKNEEIASWNVELKERVKERTRELHQAQEQIIRSQKMAVVAELSAGIAHEINNPLTSIMGFSQYMLKDTSSEHKFQKYLTLIVSGAKRIQTLVDDMLRFGKTSDNPTFTDVDLNLLLENTISMVSRQLTELGIETRTHLSPNLPLANGDPSQLQQAFVHILNNARGAMPKGGALEVGTEPVEGGAIKVSIQDTGEGIPEEKLSKIFDLFYTTRQGGENKGFGLSVADRIVRDHKGKISVSSKIGIGSIFTIFLPGVQKGTYLS